MGGYNWTKEDSIEACKINTCNGILIGPKVDRFYYIVFKNAVSYNLITTTDSLIEFVKPINTLEEAFYLSSLYGYWIDPIYETYYKNKDGIFEMIMLKKDFDRIKQLRKGAYLYYPRYYIRINPNCDIYKKKIGTKRIRIRQFNA
jgi:hypothetical protein